MLDPAWGRLGEYLRETQLIGSIQNTLYWDQNTQMPVKGAEWRGEQMSLLATNLHSRQTSVEFEELLKNAKQEFEQIKFDRSISESDVNSRQRNLELLEQDFIRQSRLDPILVCKLAKAKAKGYNRWQEAKLKSEFKYFQSSLKEIILLRQEQAKQLDEERSCWETLAQPFEPDLTIKRMNELFRPLRERLPHLIDNVRGVSFKPNWDLDENSQQELSEQLLNEWGRDINLTTVSRSPHPFSITLGPKDFRITTRVVKNQPLSCFLATAHEWGHSLYEQGLPSQSHQWFAWPLGQATSMALHESQSLFWENRVARSKAFSERFWQRFKEKGAPLSSSSDLWLAMNPLMPGLNRVEADELTYGMHILIRADLEIDLLENGLGVEDLPLEWNRRYEELLGVNPSNDAEGCLQDVHWSEGQFGYFPSYLLGHLISAQLSEALISSLRDEGFSDSDPIEACVREGNESTLLNWLRESVHIHGRRINAEELVKMVSGKPLSSEPFLNYLDTKLENLKAAS